MLLVHLCTLLLIGSVLSLSVEDRDLDKEFTEWKIKHHKVYSSPEEEAERRAIWEKTRQQVEAHNKEADQGLHTYRQGLNQFSDQKEEERRRGCLLPPPAERGLHRKKIFNDDSTSLNSTSLNSTSLNSTSLNSTSLNSTSLNSTIVAEESSL